MYFVKWLPVEGEPKNDEERSQARLTEEIEVVNPKTGKHIVTINDELIFLHKEHENYVFSVKKDHGTGASGIVLSKNEFKLVKLFLCSRDIQVGDKCLHHHPKHDTFDMDEHIIEDLHYSDYKPYEVHTNNGFGPKESYFKVIGEISPDAHWVTEEMEFDEYEEWWWSKAHNQRVIKKLDQAWDKKIASDNSFKSVVLVKCPCCGTFK